MGGARVLPARSGSRPLPLTAPARVPQIFNLMKFDSYARFVKSPLYRECLLAEAEGRPLREPGSSSPGSPDSTRKVRTGGCGQQGAGCRSVEVCPWSARGLEPSPVPAPFLYPQKPKLKPGKSLPLGVEELGHLPATEGSGGRPLRKSFRRGEGWRPQRKVGVGVWASFENPHFLLLVF